MRQYGTMPRMRIEVILSVVAIVMSATSLVWQVLSWMRSGPVVSVTAVQAFVPLDDGAERFVNVTARNTGRAPITVTGWGFRTPGGGSLVQTHSPRWSASLPHRLEPASEAGFLVPTDDVKATCADCGIRYQDLRAFVHLADGRTALARRRGIGLAEHDYRVRVTSDRDRQTRWLLTGCVACGLAAIVLFAVVVSMTHRPPAGQDPPKVTDWMQGWGSLAGVLAGAAAAGAAGWLLLHERQQTWAAQEQLREERAEMALRPVRGVTTSWPTVQQDSSVRVHVWNLALRPVLRVAVTVAAPEGDVDFPVEEILPPDASVWFVSRSASGLKGLTEGNAREAAVTVSFFQPNGAQWRRVNNGEPEILRGALS